MGVLLMVLLLVSLPLGPVLIVWMFGFSLSHRAEVLAERFVAVLRRRVGRPDPRVGNPPIEGIVVDVRRLGVRYHTLHPHTPFAKVEAVRVAYDRALGECCTALGLTHLLGVLDRGPEQDAERTRVETQLAASGVQLPYAA